MKYCRTKKEIMECLAKRIEEEQQFVLEAIQDTEEMRARELARYRKDSLAGKTDLGKHLGQLVELHRRYEGDAREAIDLSSDDFETIIDGVNGGMERIMRARLRGGLDRVNSLFKMIGLPPMREDIAEALTHSDDCDDPDCQIHGEHGLMASLGMPRPATTEDEEEEPVGKIGTMDDDCCGGCDPAVSEDTPETAKDDPVGATADAS